MSEGPFRPVLSGQKALVIGVANDDSIAYGCAKAFRIVGAELAMSWLNEKARKHVEPLAQELEAAIVGEVDVTVPGQLEAMFDQIRSKWGGSTSWCIRSPSRLRPTFRAGFSTVRPKASPRRWTFRAIPSFAWRSSPRR